MFLLIKDVVKSLFSPRLYKLHNDGPVDNMYQPLALEKWADKMITSAHTILNITLYTSPFIGMYAYKRGYYSSEGWKAMAPYIGCVSMFLVLSFIVRAYGRATNTKYMMFLRDIQKKPDQSLDSYMAAVRKYDFDFSAWPVFYKVNPKTGTSLESWVPNSPFGTNANRNLSFYQRTTIQLLAFIATHTFALRLIYPGSLGVVHQYLWLDILQARVHLVEKFKGQRSKVKTADGNCIDTMFVDNRWTQSNGDILVICCEGNSGFYEVGIMHSPVKVGYSVLGWNHPGFAESTGLPYPYQEHNAIDAVMQYAINKLRFRPEDIVMLGWSIGGYSAAWAAAHYPVRGVILDATFDDLLPLATRQMPASWALLVKEVVRSYVNLNVSEVIKRYDGRVLLVRRTDDEIICLTPGNVATNRGNQLLIDLIRHRHAAAVDGKYAELALYANTLESQRPALDSPSADPVLNYVSNYMIDVRTTHCMPIPEDDFRAIMKRFMKMQ